MHIVEPNVFLVAETRFIEEPNDEDSYADLESYLSDVAHAPNYWPEGRTEAENLIEVGGRLCYRSFEVGLNPNVTKIREDHADYIGNILKSGHGSVLEHGVVSFIIVGSRILTHELVRHRAGTAFSQESMRFVRLDDIPFWHSPWIANKPHLLEKANKLIAASEEFIAEVTKEYDLDNPASTFAFKKQVTSAQRRYAPAGHMTSILFTSNIRALRHIIAMRTAPSAEEEIRIVFDKVASLCKERYPAVFQDMEPLPQPDNAVPAWTFKNQKV